MLLVHHRVRLAVAAPLALAEGAAGGACDPTPTFPAPTQPLVGRVVFERELTMGTEPIELRTYAATLNVEPGTVPVGTKLLVRILDGVVKELTGEGPSDVWSFGQPGGAVQIVSDVTTFARPILLTVLQGYPVSGLADLLHADEAAPAWTRVGKVTTPTPPSAQFTAELTGPHLWSIAIPPVAQLSPPNGLYRVDKLICGSNDKDVAVTPNETLQIDQGRYVWTREPAGGGCAVVERGLIWIELSIASATFEPDVGDGYFFNIYVGDNDSFELKTILARKRECPAEIATTLAFVPASDGADAGAPPEASDGGCAADAGGGSDAQGG
jgi:hypothetical protein